MLSRSKKRAIFLVGASLAGLQAAAQAQAADDQAAGGDIVVTATRREANVRDVPIAVQAFTSQAIERSNITRPADFINLTANVNLSEAVRPGEANVSMRGVQGNFGLTLPVAIVIDGVVMPSPNALQQELVDVTQIEVVKGPQSSLYGRNASAGAIVISTRKPGAEVEGKLLAGGGNGDTTRAQAMISGPLGSGLFGRLALSSKNSDGFWRNAFLDRGADYFREQVADTRIIYDTGGTFTADLRGRYSRTRMGAQLWTTQFLTFDNNHSFPDFQTNNGNANGRQQRIDASLKLDYDLGIAVATLTGSYNRLRASYTGDSPVDGAALGPTPVGTPVPLPGYNYRQTGNSLTVLNETDKTVEFRVASPSSQAFRWMVGAYYSDVVRLEHSQSKVDKGINIRDLYSPEVLDRVNGTNPVAAGGWQAGENHLRDTALFARVEYDILPGLQAAGGLRWDHERNTTTNKVPAGYTPNPGFQNKASFDAWQPNASLRYKISPDASAYASYGRGVRVGGFNRPGSSATIAPLGFNFPEAYKTEKSDAFEVGLKSAFIDRRLTLNVAAFHYTIHNAQNFTAFPTSPPVTIVVNQDKVISKGFEIEASFRIIDGLTISDSFGLTDAKFKESQIASTIGNRVPLSPKYSNVVAIDYVTDLTDSMKFMANGSWRRTGTMWFDIYNTPNTDRQPFNLFDGRVAVEMETGSGNTWTLSLWGKNIFDKKYIVYGAPVPPTFNFNYRGQRRTYGIEASYKF
jgi:iron complex outermembrane receptor protein